MIWRALSLLTVGLLLSALAPAGAERPMPYAPVTAWSGHTMGSPYRVQLVGVELDEADLHRLKAAVESQLNSIVHQMSDYDPHSELARFNAAPAGKPVRVSAALAEVVRFALEVSRRSEGAFDPTVAPLVQLWGFGPHPRASKSPPSAEELRAALARTGWQHVRVTAKNELVKDRAGITLDLGGVAKGYAVDRVAALLEQRGFNNFQVAIAGEIYVRGHSPRGARWHLGIASPVDHWRETDPMAAGVWLSHAALSTSGDYQKFHFDARGHRICHILDPRTGQPVSHSLAAVSVIATNSMTADALGTALFVMGAERGRQWVETWPSASALFLLRRPDGTIEQWPSARFAERTDWEPLQGVVRHTVP